MYTDRHRDLLLIKGNPKYPIILVFWFALAHTVCPTAAASESPALPPDDGVRSLDSLVWCCFEKGCDVEVARVWVVPIASV